MIKKIPFIFVLLVIFTSLTMPVMVFAQGTAQGVTMEDSLRPQYATNFSLNPNSTSSRAAVGNIVLQLIAGSLIYAAGPVAVLMIAIGGFRYVISHGDQTQMESAKKTITWAIIGLIVIIFSYAIVTNIIKIAENTGNQNTQTSGQTSNAPTPPTPSNQSNPPTPGQELQ
jgi:hypothetical protein